MFAKKSSPGAAAAGRALGGVGLAQLKISLPEEKILRGVGSSDSSQLLFRLFFCPGKTRPVDVSRNCEQRPEGNIRLFEE